MMPDLRKDREDTASGVGGGLLVFAKAGMQILPLDTHCTPSQHVGFTILTGTDRINVILVYRPPKSSVESFRNVADLIRRKEANTVIFGDFNLPSIDWTNSVANNENLSDILEACYEKFVEQLIDFPTHLKGNILDLLLTNVPERITEINNEGRLGSSDHFMISASMLVHEKRETREQLTKNWWRADWAAIKNELAVEDWSELDVMSASEGWNYLCKKVEKLIEEHVPTKPRGSQGRPPWMTRNILREVRKKRRMWAKEKGNNVSQAY
jgi:Endonuclease-reverse transcriptase